MFLIRVLRYSLTVLCVASLCSFVEVRGATVTTDPALPLLDVPFCATPSSDLSGRSLFVSSASDCSTILATAGFGCLGSGSFAFNVTSSSLQLDLSTPIVVVPLTYWCTGVSGSAATVVETLHMNVVQTVPMYYPTDRVVNVTFNEATPVGTTIAFVYADGTCRVPIAGYGQFTLETSRKVEVRIAVKNVGVCAIVTSPVKGGSTLIMLLRNTLFGGPAVTISPHFGVRYSSITVTTNNYNIYYCALSNTETCSDLPPPTVPQVGNPGTLALTIAKPLGSYYFCVAEGRRLYYSSVNMFDVIAYGVLPMIGYANWNTKIYPSINATSNMQVALFNSDDCGGMPRVNWATFTDALWNVSLTGTYYACVRTSSAASIVYYANTYAVAPAPILTTNQSVAVRGFELSLTLDAFATTSLIAEYIAALSSNADCNALYRRSFAIDGMTVDFVIGEDATSTLYWCVSNPILNATTDNEGTAVVSYIAVGSIGVRDYQLTYSALHTYTAVTFTLDNSASLTSGSVVAFVPSWKHTCANMSGSAGREAVQATVSSNNTLNGIIFPEAGHWLMCVQLNGCSSSYTKLQSVDVYGDAVISPRGFIPKMTTSFEVTGLQPFQPVFVTTGTGCSSDAKPLVTDAADGNGTASFTVIYNSTGRLIVCGAFTGMKDGAAGTTAELRRVASLVSTNPHVFPSVIELSTGEQQLRVVGDGAGTLLNKRVTLTSMKTPCLDDTALPNFAIVLSPLQLTSDPDTLSTTLTLNSNMMDTRYRVCVETNATYIDAGSIAITRARFYPATTSSPILATAGQLTLLTFPSNYTSVALIDTYRVVDADVNCTKDVSSAMVYASGSIDAISGAAAPFVAPTAAVGTTMNLRVCIAKQSELFNGTYGYMDGGALTSSVFTAVSKYVVSDLSGGATGWPVLSYASLYLARCLGSGCAARSASSTCTTSWPQYDVNNTASTITTTTSTLSTGTYLLCQRVTSGSIIKVVGSNSTIEVINAYSMSSTADVDRLRPFVDFDAVVRGGNSNTIEIVVQPLFIPCGATASTSQAFNFTANVQRTVKITAITGYTPIHFCAKPSSQTADAFEVMTATLRSYVSPTYITFSSLTSRGTVTVSLPTVVSAQAMLTRGPDCSVSIAGGAPRTDVDGTFTFTVPPCGENSDLNLVHFCDLSAGIATYRGSLLLLRSGNCDANDNSAAIKDITVVPGAPITDFGANNEFFTVTGISTKSDCSVKMATATVAVSGYVPSVGENAVFYVCTTLISSPNVAFTTHRPTLTVSNYAVTPSLVRSPLSILNSGVQRVAVVLNNPLPVGYAFFSSGANCTLNIGDAPGLNTTAASAVYSYASLCGTVSVCWQPSTTSSSGPIAVAQFTSVTTPALQSSTLAVVRGAFYSATFAGDSCSSAIAAFSEQRVYLSADQCASVLDGTTAGTNSVSFTTSVSSDLVAGLSTVSLCTSTAAGVSTVLEGVPVAPDKVYPVSFTTGTTKAHIFMPGFASTTFWLSAKDVSCASTYAATSSLLTFETDASGYSTMNIVSANGLPLPVGDYALCYASSGSAIAIDTLSVVPPTFFDVRGISFVTGVASKMLMQEDLQASDLLEGFSTASDCSALSTSYGTWSRVSATSIKVIATRAVTSGAYLCARVPLNLSVAALPNAWSNTAQSLTFARSALTLPSAGFDTCTDYKLRQCGPPNGGGNDETNRLTVIYGDCCNSSDEANAVGVGSMASGMCSLHFDAAKVRSHPANTVFSLCAWNSYDASVCATLDYVTVSTDCHAAMIKHGDMSSVAMAGITVACIFGGLVVIAVVFFVVYYCRRRSTEEGKASWKNGGDNDSSVDFVCLSDAVFTAEWAEFPNFPPEGNNCGRAGRLNVSTTAVEMRRDVLKQLSKSRRKVDLRASWRAPLDTNFMDGCDELTEKYKDFVNCIPCVEDEESVSDFPCTAFVHRSQRDTEALLAQAGWQRQALALSEVSQAEEVKLQRFELLATMTRTNPAAKVLYLLCEEEGVARKTVEVSEETAFFNILTLSMSYKEMLVAQKGRSVVPRTSSSSSDEEDESTDSEDHRDAVFGLDSRFIRREGTPPPPSQAVTAHPLLELTPAQARENAWLYKHRSELEFPWVTNSLRTLVGYRKNNGERYHYVDWSFTLIDLQAFHPLHRWWSPLLPPVTALTNPRQAADDACDARFAFMRPKSTVPFVRRFFMLFKVEYMERVRIETQEAINMSLTENLFLDLVNKLGIVRAQPKSRGNVMKSLGFQQGSSEHQYANPLIPSDAAGRGGSGTSGEVSRCVDAAVERESLSPTSENERFVFSYRGYAAVVFDNSSQQDDEE